MRRISQRLFLVLLGLISLALEPSSWAQEEGDMIVSSWATDTHGHIRVSVDGVLWQSLPPPSISPIRATYDGATGLYKVLMDDHRPAFVQSRSFLHADGALPCRQTDNSTRTNLSTTI